MRNKKRSATNSEQQEEQRPESEAEPQGKVPKVSTKLLKRAVNLKQIIINVSGMAISDADTHYPVVTEVAEQLGWKVHQKEDGRFWDVFWTDSAVLPSVLYRMHFFQKINHYPGVHMIARKNLLGLGLMGMRQRFPQEYNFFPLTWMLPSQHLEFRRYVESLPPDARTFIVKPEAGCQGRGIYLTQNIKDILTSNRCVVQNYLSRPYLLEKLKFDFRIYVLLAGTDPLRIYLYDEGLARLATEQYEQPNPQNLKNLCMHLTNYAINKSSPNFVFNTSEKDMGVGHKRSLSNVLAALRKHGVDVDGLNGKIKDIIIKTLLTGMPVIAEQYRACKPEEYSGNMCFHILGLDIMLTDKLEPILLEVNHTPSFTTDTPLDHHIKFKLIRDTLVLMNINLETKKQLFEKAKSCLEERVQTGKRRIFEGREKEQEIARMQGQRDEYEQSHMGGFERIHPTSDPKLNKKYETMVAEARRLYYEQHTTRKNVKKDKEDQPINPPAKARKVTQQPRGSEVCQVESVIVEQAPQEEERAAERARNTAVSLSPNSPIKNIAVRSSLYEIDHVVMDNPEPARRTSLRNRGPSPRGSTYWQRFAGSRKATRKESSLLNPSLLNIRQPENMPQAIKEQPEAKPGRYIRPTVYSIVDQAGIAIASRGVAVKGVAGFKFEKGKRVQ